jgi:thioredoxin-like negative regulator of GroEL
MPVARLSKSALQKILQGKVNEKATCVIKFYSNTCHYCKELHEPYVKLAGDYDDVHFFAFNIGDYPQVEKILGFKGIPTLCLIKTGMRMPKQRVIPDPEEPNKKMWYHIDDIKEFIEREK